VKSVRRHLVAIEERLAVVAYQRVAGQLFSGESAGKPYLLAGQALKRRYLSLKCRPIARVTGAGGELQGRFPVANSVFGTGFQLSWDVQAIICLILDRLTAYNPIPMNVDTM
jgi:hypothetical protein